MTKSCEISSKIDLALLLCLVDAWLCLVDFDEVCVHAALYDAVINHSSVGFWNDSLILCQLPDSATFWVLIDDRRLSSIVTALGRNRCLLRGSLSTFIGWRCKENANRMQNIKLAWIFCWDAAFLLQRYNKKQLFAIVCSDFVLKKCPYF